MIPGAGDWTNWNRGPPSFLYSNVPLIVFSFTHDYFVGLEMYCTHVDFIVLGNEHSDYKKIFLPKILLILVLILLLLKYFQITILSLFPTNTTLALLTRTMNDHAMWEWWEWYMSRVSDGSQCQYLPATGQGWNALPWSHYNICITGGGHWGCEPWEEGEQVNTSLCSRRVGVKVDTVPWGAWRKIICRKIIC